MIGVQSSIIMFPINLLIVSIFRNTRPREKAGKTDACKQGKTVRVSPSQTSSPQKQMKNITPDTVIKVTSINLSTNLKFYLLCSAYLTHLMWWFLHQDIKRIAQSLSKAMKSPLPQLDLRPGQQADINTLLSLVEDIIRQQNRACGDFYTDASKKECAMILTLGAVNLQGKLQQVLMQPIILFIYYDSSVAGPYGGQHLNYWEIKWENQLLWSELNRK